LRYRLKGSKVFETVAISWGYCEVNPREVLVLAETAETKDQIDIVRAERALQTAQSKLIESGLEPDQIKKFQRKVQRAQVRLSMKSL
jgi:F0F1-type ATP synthase epsilon subunit